MTATAPRPVRDASSGVRVRLDGVVLSELLKLVTVRSTWWSIVVSVLLALALALALGAVVAPPKEGSVSAFVAGGATLHLQFVGLVIAVLGALSLGGEYSTGMIRSTYTAVPRRVPSLLARGVVVAVASFVVGVLTCVGSFAVIGGMLAAKGTPTSLLDDGVLGSLLGGGLSLAVIGAFSVAVAALLRSTAAAIGLSVGVLFVLPLLASIAGGLLQAQWIIDVSPYLLSNLGLALSSVPSEGSGVEQISTTSALLASAGWLLAVWVPALTATRVRDV
ncbi:ABC transporter permease [Rathayibacter sp. VKM Ac-2927]|uniref:ABC transporter permease n=1 Tax=Rathayibacter sp. VKM Ac-2927 TaxID=2929478 RepID=UPI001FB456A3|nr:ABC transporter permease [Rathayibacter sp. VKM Ac-2927]MCJ1686390.1 ABC transporter permease [Rathayibacter sp. VKM Ac-2927]